MEKVLGYFEPERAPRWGSKYCGHQLARTEDNRRISVLLFTDFTFRHLYYNGAQSAQPCSRYSVKVVVGKNILIGFAPRRGFRKDMSSSSTQGWFIDLSTGGLIAQGHRLVQTEDSNTINRKRFAFWSLKTPLRLQRPKYRYGLPIFQGSIVTALHDRRQHTIAFQVDGQSLGIAFTNISESEPLYAAAEVYGFYLNADIRIAE